MFLPQLAQGLRGIHHVLTSGATFATAVWSAPDKVPMISTAMKVVGPFLNLPPPGPGDVSPFSLAEPGKLEQAMSSAGFQKIHSEHVTVVATYESRPQYLEFVKDTAPFLEPVSQLPAERQAELWKQIEAATTPFVIEGGQVQFVGDAVCVAGRK
jgi:hypothetical protein